MPTKQNKPIALICNSINSAVDYFKYKIGIVKITNNIIELRNGTQVIVITSMDEIQEREFSDVWIHPEYEDELVASVKARVR